MSMTDGRRIYVLGDIHGCIDALTGRLTDIRGDLMKRPHPDPVLICLGDYTDRGPDSRGVLDTLISLKSEDWIESHFLFGNHDKLFLDYIADPMQPGTQTLHWLDDPLGGGQTLASYGIDPARTGTVSDTHAAFAEAVPTSHLEFLRQTELSYRIGGYLFVHAGILPGVPLDKQDPNDLIWIRGPFLNSREDHGFVVVHGHTVVEWVEDHGNRIAIDTGAVFGGALACLVLEDDNKSVLIGPWHQPLLTFR